MSIADVMSASKVVPVLAFEGVEEAVEVSRALVGAGVPVLEITLRHPTALEAIRAVARALPEAIVGAGTVLNAEQAQAARDAGATFGVSPGLTPALADAVKGMGWDFLPGVASVSEAMSAREMGFSALKFFPAEVSGGVGFLRAVGAVLPGIRFCPTGGVKANTAANYLALDNVPCVGGSWLTPRDEAGDIDLDVVKAAARAARAL